MIHTKKTFDNTGDPISSSLLCNDVIQLLVENTI
jgi:hypothetical protein